MDTDWLLFSGNNLGILNQQFDYTSNLVLLNISSSDVTSIGETAMETIVNNIKTFDIRRNKLKTLPKTITKVPKGNNLWISDNPYECHCDMIWMKDWLLNTQSVMDKENVTCSGGKVKGKVLKHVTLHPCTRECS